MLMRYSRINAGPNTLYKPSSTVFLMEVVKFVICLGVILSNNKFNLPKTIQHINFNLLKDPTDVIKLSIPSFLYTIQNNLLYIALTHLDSATYQVLYQSKILTTALFSVLLLDKKLGVRKWGSLAILTIGVILAQSSGAKDGANNNNGQGGNNGSSQEHSRSIGVLCVSVAAVTSGFSGVYFEKILKSSNEEKKVVDLWTRNIQMGVSSIILSFVTFFFIDHLTTPTLFFTGYNWTVIFVILVQAAGGLLVALVVKYTDNIAKVFAASFSIVGSAIMSYFFFNFVPDAWFLVGAGLVTCSVVFYSLEPGSGGGGVIKKRVKSFSGEELPLIQASSQDPSKDR